MGLTQSQSSTMAESYLQLSAQTSSLIIHFYGIPLKQEPLVLALDTPLTYDQVMVRCSKHLSDKLGPFFARWSEKTLGPWLLPLFGLYAKDHSLQQWTPDCQVFDQSYVGQEFYFRIKVRLPVVANSLDSVPQGIFADYLFWQCAEDFLSGRLWELFGADNKIEDINSVNFNVLHVFMASAPYQKHDLVTCHMPNIVDTDLENLTSLKFIKQKVRPWNMLRRFPEKMSPQLQKEYNMRKDFLLRCITFRFLHKYITEFFNQNKKLTLRVLRTVFVNKLLKEFVPKYGLERFEAEKLRRDDFQTVKVELIIRPFQDGCIPGLYFNSKLVARLQDIRRVDIPEMDSSSPNQKCRVNLEFRSQVSMTLLMNSRDSAESFVSVLDIYYRLKVNYYGSLRDEPQRAPVLRVLCMLRSYGPLREEEARKQLRARKAEDRRLSPDMPQYLIYQDSERFGLLHLLGTVDSSDHITGYDITFQEAQSESGFLFTVYTSTVEANEVARQTSNPRMLMIYLNEQSGQHIVPKEDELCGAMHLLKDSNSVDPYYSDISDERRETCSKDMPALYTEDKIMLPQDSLIGKGKFCEVHLFTLMEKERKVVLKKVTSENPVIQEAYRRGAQKLLKLGEGCHNFVKVYGMMMASPLRIVMESMPANKGSLLQYLKSTAASPFTWFHFTAVLRQLAACLDHLNEKRLTYGAFCCAKILIMSEVDNEIGQSIIIRLGDPSLALYLDALPLTDPQNQERLAWIAPERFNALRQHDVHTEVYALGTTLWEMAAVGKIPTNISPCHQSDYQMLDFLGKESDPEDPNQLPDSIQSQEWTRQWWLTQNFSQQASRDEDEASIDSQQASGDSQQASSDSQQAGGDTQQTGGDSQQASGDSQQASGDSQLAGDVTEYVTGAKCSEDSGPERGQGVGQLAGGGDQGQTTGPQLSVKLQEVKKKVRRLIRACWHSDPNQRPSPTDFFQQSSHIKKLVEEAASEDSNLPKRFVLEQAMCTGLFNNPANAHKLQQQLQAMFHVDQGGQGRVMDEQEQLKTLEQEVWRSMQCSIEVSRLDFTDSRCLGKGNFGVVKTAMLSRESETREEEEQCRKEAVLVAVKMISDDHKPNEVSQFLKEALCICKLEHRNIVRLIGIVMKGARNPYQLVMEYADQGSLEVYVFKNKQLLNTLHFKKFLKSFAIDVAKGMEYVHHVNRVHGDLAARNVLLFRVSDFQKDRPPVAKLCDFGLSHQLFNGYYSLCKSSNKNPQLPAYLLPPEVLRAWPRNEVKLTIGSDIWSYGIFLWEIFSNTRPENILGKVYDQILSRLGREKDPLPKPNNCSPKMFDIMRKCWEREKHDRPQFTELLDLIEQLTDHDLDLD